MGPNKRTRHHSETTSSNPELHAIFTSHHTRTTLVKKSQLKSSRGTIYHCQVVRPQGIFISTGIPLHSDICFPSIRCSFVTRVSKRFCVFIPNICFPVSPLRLQAYPKGAGGQTLEEQGTPGSRWPVPLSKGFKGEDDMLEHMVCVYGYLWLRLLRFAEAALCCGCRQKCCSGRSCAPGRRLGAGWLRPLVTPLRSPCCHSHRPTSELFYLTTHKKFSLTS